MNSFNKDKWSEPFSAIIGAYDIEKIDSLYINMSRPLYGNHTLSNIKRTSLEIQPCPDNPKVTKHLNDTKCIKRFCFCPVDRNNLSNCLHC
jgi:hypothetical protein